MNDSEIKEPSFWAEFAVHFVILFGSPVIGVVLANTFAPESTLAYFANFIMFWAAFFISLFLTVGLTIIILLIKLPFFLLFKMIKKKADTEKSKSTNEEDWPSGIVFIPVSMLICSVGGFITGVVSNTRGVMSVVGIYVLIGALFGFICHWIIKNRYIKPDEWEFYV